MVGYGGADVVDDPEMGVVWVRFTRGGPKITVAKCVRWPDEGFGERLEALEQRMHADGDWPAISIADGVTRPAGLAAELEQRGWHKVGGERVMFTRHAPVVPHLDPGLRIEAVTAASAPELVHLEVASFGLPVEEIGERVARLTDGLAVGDLRGFIVRLVGEPVAGARLVTRDRTSGVRIAALSAIGVAERQRGRGYGRLVTAVATRAGLATGHGLVWLSVDEANAPAVKLYENLGYERSFATSRWLAPAVT
jgi:ribosomal protein S18 acetylase RimI-like enzyme